MIDQLAIAFFGVAAVFLSQQPSERLRKFACLSGLAAQPFWFMSSYANELWGIFFVSILYTLSWLTGVRYYWIRPLKARLRGGFGRGRPGIGLRAR